MKPDRRAKLTRVDVERIRELRRQGAFFRDLAAAFGVSINTIEAIIQGRRW